jgi:hypothetical protein
MTPVGYMAKHIVSRPDWLKDNEVKDIYSVSNCVSDDFADYINFWKHNGYWFFDAPSIIRKTAEENGIELENTKLFYYEVYELEYNDVEKSWESFSPEDSFQTNIIEPKEKHLEGYDIVNFYVHTSPECSPLSCNSVATEVKTNKHCLLPTFEDAKQLIESGRLEGAEPGPYRIFSVYSVKWP